MPHNIGIFNYLTIVIVIVYLTLSLAAADASTTTFQTSVLHAGYY